MWNPASRSALPSGTSRDPRRRQKAALGFAFSLAVAALNAACSSGARAVRLPALSPSDEIYRISCEDSIQVCRDEAAEVCAGKYDVLETAGAPVVPPRVTSAPGPASTGPKYQRAKWIGQMVVACGTAPASRTVGASDAARETLPPGASMPAVPADRLCIPGVTQECLGPGACRGAQACLSDGNGYGPCDCGGAGSHIRSTNNSVVTDAGASPTISTDQ
jgi:hypothetical protein